MRTTITTSKQSPPSNYQVRHRSTTPHLQLWGTYQYKEMAQAVADRCNKDETLAQFIPFTVIEVQS